MEHVPLRDRSSAASLQLGCNGFHWFQEPSGCMFSFCGYLISPPSFFHWSDITPTYINCCSGYKKGHRPRLSSWSIIILPSIRRAEFWWFDLSILISVSFYQGCFLRDGFTDPMPNPPSFPELGTGSKSKRATGRVGLWLVKI